MQALRLLSRVQRRLLPELSSLTEGKLSGSLWANQRRLDLGGLRVKVSRGDKIPSDIPHMLPALRSATFLFWVSIYLRLTLQDLLE